MKKHAMVITTIAMLLLSGFMGTPVIGEDYIALLNGGDTISVDDEGDGDYITIQDAVDNASFGDIIEVYSGTYTENIVIDVCLTLIGIDYELANGSDIGKPIIDGKQRGCTIEVRDDNCNIQGFNIKNGDRGVYLHSSLNNTISNNDISYNGRFGIWLIESSNNTIFNNTISHHDSGIEIEFSSYKNKIFGNTIFKSKGTGINVEFSSKNEINENIINNSRGGIILNSNTDCVKNNTIEDNDYGILALGTKCVISNNILSNKNYDLTLLGSGYTIKNNEIKNGIVINSYERNSWTDNIIENNAANGKKIYYYKNLNYNSSNLKDAAQVIIANCSHMKIQNLTLSHINRAISIGFSNNINISSNKISYCSHEGIDIVKSFNIEIFDNDISHIYGFDTGYGIKLQRSVENKISFNNISYNRYNGISLSESNNNLIFSNRIWKNEGGIGLMGSRNNSIYENTIYENSYLNSYGSGINMIYWSANNSVFQNEIKGSPCGIYLTGVNNNNVSNNLIKNNLIGIEVTSWHSPPSESYNNTIFDNNITDNHLGIILRDSCYDKILCNTVSNNIQYGLVLFYSFNSKIIDNNLVSNGINIYGGQLGHWNSHVIEHNTANNKPIYYYKDNNTGGKVSSNAAQVILANCQNFKLENLDIDDVDTGVQLGFSSSNTILFNIITNCNCDGIFLSCTSSNNIISDNTIINNRNGIELGVPFSDESGYNNYNLICRNKIIANQIEGIVIPWNSNYNSIKGNTITNNDEGILLYSSSNNELKDNNISNNGYGIWALSSSDNEISKNTIVNNYQGIYFGFDSEEEMLINTSIENVIETSLENHSRNSIFEKYLFKNWKNVSSEQIISTANINNDIIKNIIYDNEEGIYISDSENTVIRWNNIKGNTDYGLKVVDNNVNARLNWWGSMLGPNGARGDCITSQNGRIKFFPWLPFRNIFAGANNVQK